MAFEGSYNILRQVKVAELGQALLCKRIATLLPPCTTRRSKQQNPKDSKSTRTCWISLDPVPPDIDPPNVPESCPFVAPTPLDVLPGAGGMILAQHGPV